MNSQPLVSTVIATYNTARYLPLAVRSVLEQTYRNIQLHLVDDGSADNTREVMKQFTTDPRANYHFPLPLCHTDHAEVFAQVSRSRPLSYDE